MTQYKDLTTKQKKETYVVFIEELVYTGYNISNLLNPIYKNIDFDYVVKRINELRIQKCDGPEFAEFFNPYEI
jgi:hypothetical protein